MIYLDNSATTKPFTEVIESFQKVSERFYGNPSSVHQFGTDAEALLRKAREQAATLLDVSPEEIIFTSGGTEGNNMAIKGIAFAHQNRGKHIITTQIEHPSVLDACKALETLGFKITYLPVNNMGCVTVEDVENAITDETILISIMHVNNELGSVQPIEEIGDIAAKYPKLFFHVDHVQGLGKVDLDFKKSKIDLCTVSGHKIHGLKGTGLLYVKRATTLFPLFHGGGQERGFRSGTENLAGAVSFVKALRLIKEAQISNKMKLKTLNDKLRNCLEAGEEVVINSPVNGAPHILNFSALGYKPEVLIHALEEKGFYISTKSACSSKDADESAILTACGFGFDRSSSALRISLTYENSIDEMITFCEAFHDVINSVLK
ncbi:cysteine desulfurase [Aquibacillus sp. 3ASR75-11]|uniref:Cysteine desulfurase n=1 Tax=Terrihalobacillus insolitus TaxID=2950438 RepID=A0A9X3WQ24_9BACI|nr:cysteine desulfurase family protein [Terrihalobacillus insolitus]MDC3412667.1 cysteine desulfurase [Terrihalobacillus insolitus]MDC3424017.1 cysteine desulfurase [Terrihalobacillus insolitus]